ncbi:MAG: M50 family metallopeptidase, partial [Planctomycetales bacterium]
MFLSEPQPTQYDVRFTLLGIPVIVNPWFWGLSVLLGFRLETPVAIATWVFSVFVSILVHEFGHILGAKMVGWNPQRVILHSFGGLAVSHPSTDNPYDKIWVSFAGPLAGFMLAVLVLVTLLPWGHVPVFYAGFPLETIVEGEWL